MPQLKELKKQMIAGSAIKTFDFFLQWHLTERCNLRCRHCYQGAKDAQEMSQAAVKREIDGATEMLKAWESDYGITVSPSIHFTGGEPFLYEGLWDVVAYAKKQGYAVAMMTNGCLITPEGAQRAFHLGISDIQVSIEGPEGIHDSIRGKGSFQKAAKGVEMLAQAGNRVYANVTLSRRNVDAIETTVECSRQLGFQGVGFSRVVPCGRGKALLDDFLTSQELRTAYQRINSLQMPHYDVGSRDPLAGTFNSPGPSADDLTLSGCSAGFSGVTITSDGSVMPCRRIGLVAGNLKRKSLRAIWASSDILWRLRTRESYHGRCGSCHHWASCRGCRAVAYAYSVARGKPDLFADDPQCWITEEPTRSSTR
jgi:radical SAM protein with 4Fe4S-binding SPASM domain